MVFTLLALIQTRRLIVYYCIFHDGLPLQSREAFDASDDFIGRIPRVRIPPPRTYAALKRCVAHREGFEVDAAASIYLEGSDEPVANTIQMRLQEGSLGTTFNAPVAIVFDPAACRKRDGQGRRVRSEPAWRIRSDWVVYYCVFHAGLPLQSREAFDASDDFIGRIPRIHIPQPRTFAALKRCIAHREGFEADAVASMYLEGNDEAVIDTDFMQL
ncbi:hypothetical protein DL93DRAFT_2145380, partial [Clavulina sp. PMI_390]